MSGTERDVRRSPDAPGAPAAPVRHYRAAAFQAYVLVASVAFVTLAVVARTVAYFSIDLTITRFVQRFHAAWFDHLMAGLSWLGFMPQVIVLVVLVVLALAVARLRWEALVTLFAASGLAVAGLIKLFVGRPRPSADLILVLRELTSSGFPSGHVLLFTAFGGFLAFLAFTRHRPSLGRTLLLVALGLVIALMGLSRIHQGQHWFSDVMGAYLIGSLWLALAIRIYRWGHPRFFVAGREQQDRAGRT